MAAAQGGGVFFAVLGLYSWLGKIMFKSPLSKYLKLPEDTGLGLTMKVGRPNLVCIHPVAYFLTFRLPTTSLRNGIDMEVKSEISSAHSWLRKTQMEHRFLKIKYAARSSPR